MTYRERRAARAERLRDWAGSNATKSARALKTAHTIADGIPFGQPILVGHHSEKHHRRDLARIDGNMRKGIDLQDKAASQESRAAEIDRQAERAIYNDDPDAIERLREKLAGLEAERETMKAKNAAYRKGDAAFAACLGVTVEQAAQLRAKIEAGYSWCRQPHPAYELQNLGGNITRVRKRIAALEGPAAPVPVASGDAVPCRGCGALQDCTPACTATARAGLTITATTTTPRRTWKQPRPVWNVAGAIGPHRARLTDLGGTWYHGVFSFWDDPTDLIEQALQQVESEAAQ